MKEQIRLEAERLLAYGNVWKAVVKKPSYRKRMAIGFLTQWGAEFGGPLIIVSVSCCGCTRFAELTPGQNNYAVILYQGLGETGSMPLLLSAVWLTTAGKDCTCFLACSNVLMLLRSYL